MDKTRHGKEKRSRNQSRRRFHLKSNPVDPLTLKNPKIIALLVPGYLYLHIGNANVYDWLNCMAHDPKDEIDAWRAIKDGGS
uniref:Uncharacterized protein n=1 Tax=Tanacetum cinerariifolium TaxID=118510 RepID=A0A699KSS1_TANCI|nr:hypothetical protein [Tanacetum cinerariifolium]